jgi:hypothetical protein
MVVRQSHFLPFLGSVDAPQCSDVSSVHWLSAAKLARPDHKDLFLPGIQFHLITSAAEMIQQQANAEIRQQMMCKLCGKLNDESHMRSKIHLQKVVEQAQLDVALGTPSPFALRSLTPMTIKGLRCGPNAEGLTRERISAHWGCKVQSLCQFALDRFKGLGSIQLLKQSRPLE